MKKDFPLGHETYRILGACFEVYNEMCCGFLEPVYHECLNLEFRNQETPYESEKTIKISYKGNELQKRYQPDFICYQSVVVEIKAVSRSTSEHRAQLLNYLHAANLDVGLLVNFGHHPKLEYERFLSRRFADLCGSGLSVGKMR